MIRLAKKVSKAERVGLVLVLVLLAVSLDLLVLQASQGEPRLPSRLVLGALRSVGVLGQVDFRPAIHKKYLSKRLSVFAFIHHSLTKHPYRQIFSQFGGMGGGFGGMRGAGNTGGMGGMGGMGRGPSMFDDDDIGGGGGSYFGGMPGGMPGGQSGRQSPKPTSAPAPSEITRPLKVSLEDLYSGVTKHLKVSRRLLNGTMEDKVLEIQVLPGWKSGTKIRFPRAGNEQPGGESQDLVFVVEEKPHHVFTREGDDLIRHIKIPLVDALTGADGRKTIETLDGRKLQIPVPAGIVKPNQESRIPNEGMPIRKQGSMKKKGDLIVRWDVVFPDRLTPAQMEGLKKILG